MALNQEVVNLHVALNQASVMSTEIVAKLKVTCTSPVWTHFAFEANKEGKARKNEVAICRLCKWPVKVKDSKTGVEGIEKAGDNCQ